MKNIELSLDYKQFDFSILFEKPLFFDSPPEFILRSVLGYQLRKLCCIAKGKACVDCLFNKECAYAALFETILEKENKVLQGRDRATHPFSIQIPSTPLREKITKLDFRIVLLGRYTQYLPYLFFAFKNAGKDGIKKDRVPFAITELKTKEESLFIEPEKIKTYFPVDRWEGKNRFETDNSGEILVRLLTPLRFKTNGNYQLDFELSDFFACLHRRLLTVCTLYGSLKEEFFYRHSGQAKMVEKNLSWVDYHYYSGRQKNLIKMGGIKGEFTMKGVFSDYEISLLQFAQLFQAGKNPNFGFGLLKIWHNF